MLMTATSAYVEDAATRHVSAQTIKKYRQLLVDRLVRWTGDRGVDWLSQVDSQLLREFRGSWSVAAVTANKMLERLKSFFRFCHESGWIENNPARVLRPAQESQPPTMPFTREEIQRMLVWLDEYRRGKDGQSRDWAERLRALVLVLRYTGLRISDAAQLDVSHVQEGSDGSPGRILLRMAKTSVPIWVPVPPVVIEALNSYSHGNLFFGGSGGSIATRCGDLRRNLRKMFAGAGVVNGHAHRFRDTVAVELLQEGVPVDRVAAVLGHQSIRVTERHYAPWVHSRQVQLEQDLKRVWGIDA